MPRQGIVRGGEGSIADLDALSIALQLEQRQCQVVERARPGNDATERRNRAFRFEPALVRERDHALIEQVLGLQVGFAVRRVLGGRRTDCAAAIAGCAVAAQTSADTIIGRQSGFNIL